MISLQLKSRWIQNPNRKLKWLFNEMKMDNALTKINLNSKINICSKTYMLKFFYLEEKNKMNK